MATIYQYLTPEAAQFRTVSFPAFVINQGTDFPVSGLAFDASTSESAFWKWSPLGYVSGFSVDVIWYADTSSTSTHGVEWSAGIAAITPNTDTTNVETKTMVTSGGFSTDLGSTNAQKLKLTTLALGLFGYTDSMAAGDEMWLRISRNVSSGSDDLTGDAIVTSVRISYSDT